MRFECVVLGRVEIEMVGRAGVNRFVELSASEQAGVDTLMCLVELQDWDSSGDVRVAEYSGES